MKRLALLLVLLPGFAHSQSWAPPLAPPGKGIDCRQFEPGCWHKIFDTPTISPTLTVTKTRTPTITATVTLTPTITQTFTVTPTLEPGVPTSTPTETPTITETPTRTPTTTRTVTPVNTSTPGGGGGSCTTIACTRVSNVFYVCGSFTSISYVYVDTTQQMQVPSCTAGDQVIVAAPNLTFCFDIDLACGPVPCVVTACGN